jgi:hypothetical protein
MERSRFLCISKEANISCHAEWSEALSLHLKTIWQVEILKPTARSALAFALGVAERECVSEGERLASLKEKRFAQNDNGAFMLIEMQRTLGTQRIQRIQRTQGIQRKRRVG